MPYIDRDELGRIVSRYERPQREGQEFVESAELYTPPPAPLDQIRAIERTPEVADAMQRGTRLVAIAYAIDEVLRKAALKGLTVTREQAHDWSMLNDGNYKTLYDAEQVIKPLRALV
ncbi:MAG: hypothetical protein Q7K57_44630 [Burkholderiaceae bacterium]|nr:hypothetical protein [Burkholderiaceae bacterium]